MQHRRAALGSAAVDAPHIGVGTSTRNNLLLLGENGQGLDAVAKCRRFFKLPVLRSRPHLLLHGGTHLPQLAREEPRRLLHAAAILRPIGAIGAAKAVTFADMVVEAGPLLANIPRESAGAGRQLQRRRHGVERLPRLMSPTKGAEILRPILSGLADHGKAGIFLLPIQADEGIALIILQEDIIAGLMALDEGVFQDEGLKLRAHHNGVELLHLRHHEPRLFIVPRGGLEILAHAVAQLLRLAHIDDQSRLVHHEIDTWGQGQTLRHLQ